MGLFAKFGALDRRIVYLLLAAVVIASLVISFDQRHYVDRSTIGLFEVVDRIQPGSKAVLISFDYDPNVSAELDPMAEAVLRHCFAKNIPVIGMSLGVTGALLGERAITKIAREYGRTNGIDYCFFGYRYGGYLLVMGMGENIARTLPTDFYGTPVDSLPMMRYIKNYDNVGVVLCLAGSAVVNTWITFAGVQYHANIAAGLTAVSAPDYYPYLQTGQLVGQLGGMKGAAEYEQLIVERGYATHKGLASRAMNAVTGSHLMIMALIVMGNLAFLVGRKSQKKPEGRG